MLLQELIDLASDHTKPIATLLRKCVILAHRIGNARLKEWANNELNGYPNRDDVPEYRITAGPAKGNFSGAMNASWSGFPIPSHLLEEDHKRFARTVELTQAISAYEDLLHHRSTDDGTMTIPWPQNLALYYQTKLKNSRHMVLISAYQEIPRSAIVELIDTIRTRVLNLALEIQTEVGEEDGDLKSLSHAAEQKVDQTIVNNIYGGQVYVSSGRSTINVSQQGLTPGDWNQLQELLLSSGVSKAEVHELSTVIKQDDAPMGAGASGWIKRTGPKVLSGGIKMGATIGQTLLTAYLKQYWGLDS
ncbi:hypothetical protein [Tunturiibacter gelidoferens]|uniref:AbiTii domain-containing protein n=1 Tax=Tunturiibacter gelidiferens TaxID=3069689 RepID=A0A9X0U4I7_9BACT|nr:hypothetical protein [Edaphobacter lichenicola]MBB5329439.1 hypothetical protein [Edaphobacter lichenicola]